MPAEVHAALERKALLVRRGIQQQAIARKLRVSRVAVSHVVSGHRRSKRIENHIARLLAMPRAVLWPGTV